MGSSRNRPAPGPPGGDRRHGPGHRRRRPRRRRPAGPDPTPHHRGGGTGNAAVRFAARWKDSRRGGGAVNRLDCQRSSRTYGDEDDACGRYLRVPPRAALRRTGRVCQRIAVRSCRLRALAHPCPLPPGRVPGRINLLDLQQDAGSDSSAAPESAADGSQRPRAHPQGQSAEPTPLQRVRRAHRLRPGGADLGARTGEGPENVKTRLVK